MDITCLILIVILFLKSVENLDDKKIIKENSNMDEINFDLEESRESRNNTTFINFNTIKNLKKRETNKTINYLNESNLDFDNFTGNCTNDYCTSEEEYFDMMMDYMYPKHYEWVLIALHSVVFLVGLVGNALVCVAVYRNHSMRTVTNYFIVNLAVADFLVILFCLPPTVLWDVTETWFFGKAMCKIVLYIQVSQLYIVYWEIWYYGLFVEN